jgi:predicted DsbA family dithiol-disulfide isomerase
VVSVRIFSDVICPWCFIGKRRLEKALQLLAGRHEVQVEWHPFELNPQMPKEGMDRRAYRTRKFGTWEHSQALDAQVAAAGAAEGISFAAFEHMARTPNTFDAHRLIWLAQKEGQGDAVVEGLCRAYFTEGRDVGAHEVLVQVAAKAGLDAARVDVFLKGQDGAEEVLRLEGEARRLGVSAVPTFILEGGVVLSGAQPPEVIAAAIERAAEVGSSGKKEC